MRGLYEKLFARSFCTERGTKERGMYEKHEGKYFPVQDRANEVKVVYYMSSS